MKRNIYRLFLLSLTISISLLIFFAFIKSIAVKLRCQRKVQVMHDAIKIALADAVIKSDPIEDDNNAKLLVEMYKKCIGN